MVEHKYLPESYITFVIRKRAPCLQAPISGETCIYLPSLQHHSRSDFLLTPRYLLKPVPSSSCLESHYLQTIIVIMAQNTILFLGAGGNIGASSVKLFKSKGYKVASVARTIRKEVAEHSDLVMTADFSDPTTIKGIFETVERELGVPNVVVYNRK